MREYYRNYFQSDLQVFMGASSVPYFGHGWPHNCREQLVRLGPGNRARFLISLYFTVLVDQAMHAHFSKQYPQFENLTRYPKFCYGLSQFQHNPRGILLGPIEQGVVTSREVLDLLPTGMALFVDDVAEFFHDHMPEVKAAAFFEKLLRDPNVQIPELLVMVNPDLREDVAYVAYKELKAAVGRAFPREAV